MNAYKHTCVIKIQFLVIFEVGGAYWQCVAGLIHSCSTVGWNTRRAGTMWPMHFDHTWIFCAALVHTRSCGTVKISYEEKDVQNLSHQWYTFKFQNCSYLNQEKACLHHCQELYFCKRPEVQIQHTSTLAVMMLLQHEMHWVNSYSIQVTKLHPYHHHN